LISQGELEETMGGCSELEEDRGSWKRERERKGAGEPEKTKGNLMKPGEREGTLESCKVCREDLGERSLRRWKMGCLVCGLWAEEDPLIHSPLSTRCLDDSITSDLAAELKVGLAMSFKIRQMFCLHFKSFRRKVQFLSV